MIIFAVAVPVYLQISSLGHSSQMHAGTYRTGKGPAVGPGVGGGRAGVTAGGHQRS